LLVRSRRYPSGLCATVLWLRASSMARAGARSNARPRLSSRDRTAYTHR
jgi:hypothetical protein